MNNKNIENTKPFIFSKKKNDKCKIIPLNITTNTSGLTRHFLPATKEWFNNIYTFNNNLIKNLNVADRNLVKLIKSYFNFYFNNKVLKSKRLPTRFRRLSTNRIFISKAELKHTSSKVIITLYVYNEEKRILNRKIKRLEAILFTYYDNILQNKLSNKNKPFSLKEKLDIIKVKENNISLIN